MKKNNNWELRDEDCYTCKHYYTKRKKQPCKSCFVPEKEENGNE